MKVKVWEHRPGRWKYQLEGRPQSPTYYSSRSNAALVAREEAWRRQFGRPNGNIERIVAQRNQEAAEWEEVGL